MEVFYQGRPYTWAQIYTMQSHGKAKITLEEPVSYGQGQAFAFNSEAEEHQWACTHVSGLAQRPTCQVQVPTSLPTPS